VPGQPDPTVDKRAFAARCSAVFASASSGPVMVLGFRRRAFCGEINIRPCNGTVPKRLCGYWVDEAMAGNGYTPEAFVALARFAFEDLMLHRLQVSIILEPFQPACGRKLGLRNEAQPCATSRSTACGRTRPFCHHLRGLGAEAGPPLREWLLP